MSRSRGARYVSAKLKLILISAFLGGLLPAGSAGELRLDEGFRPRGFSTRSHGFAAVQHDRSILLCNYVDSVTGLGAGLYRALPDSSQDRSFGSPGLYLDEKPYTPLIQDDGRIIIIFQNRRPVRIFPDGTVDPSFSFQGDVRTLSPAALQPDGKLLVGAISGLARFKVDGSADPSFQATIDSFGSLTPTAEGQVYVSGLAGLIRLLPDGTVDPRFSAQVNGWVTGVVLASDGKLYVGGLLSDAAGVPTSGLVRLHADGTVDETFNAQVAGRVQTLALQADGRIILTGAFTQVGGKPRLGFARVHPNGDLDNNFEMSVRDKEKVVELHQAFFQHDGKIMLTGRFTEVGGGVGLAGVARLLNTEPATQNVVVLENTVKWLRAGTAPELWRTTFEISTNEGTSWEFLGNGTRDLASEPGESNWELRDVEIPEGALVRASGPVALSYNSPSSVVRQQTGPPVVVFAPAASTNLPGTNRWLQVEVTGSEPMTFQWFKNGEPLSESERFEGTTTSTLGLPSLDEVHEGEYSLHITNDFGTLSVDVDLAVHDLMIKAQPAQQNMEHGQTAHFFAEVIGAEPRTYQWLKDGIILPGQVEPTLTIANVGTNDVGYYQLTIRNPYGEVTSKPAELNLNLAHFEPSFHPPTSETVTAFTFSTPQKIIIAGEGTGYTVGRYYAWGGLDPVFLYRSGGPRESILEEPHGPGSKIYIVSKPTYGGSRRVFSDGLRDNNYPGFSGIEPEFIMTRMDGKFFIRTYSPSGKLLSVDSEGKPAPDFTPLSFTVLSSGASALLPGGSVLLGAIRRVNNTNVPGQLILVRPDGTVDPTFNYSGNAGITTVAVQPDGRILAVVNQTILRLHPNGLRDSTFTPSAVSGGLSLALQSDGSVLLAGVSNVDGYSRSGVARLGHDGKLDPFFRPNLGNATVVGLNPEGDIVLAGSFTNIGSTERRSMALFRNNVKGYESLTLTNQTLRWVRGGSLPAVQNVFFESSFNGVNWLRLGWGTYVESATGETAWELPLEELPQGIRVRAQGMVSTGLKNRSSWWASCVLGQPILLEQPRTVKTNAAAEIRFSVSFAPDPTLIVTWFKDGHPVIDSENISGSTTTSLYIRNVLKYDEGNYHVVASNAFGQVQSAEASLSVQDPIFLVEPTDGYGEPGETIQLQGLAGGTDVHLFWLKDGSALPDSSAHVLTVANAQFADIGSYNLVASNQFGMVTSKTARVVVNTMQIDTAFQWDAGHDINSIIPIPNGTLVIAGTLFSPQGGLAYRNENGFTWSVVDSPWQAPKTLALQPDDRLIIGGDRTVPDSVRYTRRFTPSWSQDTGFIESLDPVISLHVNPTNNSIVQLSPKGLRLLATNGSTLRHIEAPYLSTKAIHQNGSLLIGRTSAGEAPPLTLFRADPPGNSFSLDPAFNLDSSLTVSGVHTMCVLPSGKILLAGAMALPNRPLGELIILLNPDGTRDPSIVIEADSRINSIVSQADGKFLVGGDFRHIGGIPQRGFARFHEDGSMDNEFSGETDGAVNGITIQHNGQILLAGAFNRVGGYPRKGLARLRNRPVIESIEREGDHLTWVRGGSSPEIWTASVEYSTNSTTWKYLVTGQRLPQEDTGLTRWKFDLGSMPPTAKVRMRGYILSGNANSSSWFVERRLSLPTFNNQPVSSTNIAGVSLTLRVSVASEMPVQYQWYKDNQALSDSARTTGTATQQLSLQTMSKADEGVYSVKVKNDFGSTSSTPIQVKVLDPVFTVQPDGGEVKAGDPFETSALAAGTPDLSYQWYWNGIPLPGANAPNLTVPNATGTNSGSYFLVVSNSFGQEASRTVLLKVDDASLNTTIIDEQFTLEPDNHVNALALESTGGGYIGGEFNGISGNASPRVARYDSAGDLDAAFNPGVNGLVSAFLIETNETVVLAGEFSRIADVSKGRIARVNRYGTVDPVFDPAADGKVTSLGLHPDGFIFAGGFFTTLGGVTRHGLGLFSRIDGKGAEWPPVAFVSTRIESVAITRAGNFYAGGNPIVVNGSGWGRMVGFSSHLLDQSFNPVIDNLLRVLLVQPDGKLIIAGAFTEVNGQTRRSIARLEPSGLVDPGFAAVFDGTVYSAALQADGKIIVGGLFTHVNGAARPYLARLNANGSLDSTFNPAPDNVVFSLAIQTDGKVLAGGAFSKIGEQPRKRLVRLDSGSPAVEQLSLQNGTLQWRRGGSSPEVWRVTFEETTDDENWVMLGNGDPVIDQESQMTSWVLQGVQPPTDGTIRARGYVSTGTSSWFVETVIRFSSAPPQLAVHKIGTHIELEWSNLQTGFILESCEALSPDSSWTRVEQDITVEEHRNSLRVAAEKATVFFRLRRAE